MRVMSIRRFFVVIAITIGVLALCVLLFGGTGTQQPSGDERIYTVADSTGDWGFPSPFGMYSRGPGYVRMSFIFDTLIWRDRHGFTGAVAEDWEFDGDEEAYVFRLRRGVRWHDGEKLDAQDVVFTFDYLTRHRWSWADLDVIGEAEAVDDLTVRIELDSPYAPFLAKIAAAVPILPEHIWADVEDPDEFREREALVGSGPFELVDYSRSHGSYEYRANEDYYAGRPVVDRLRFEKYTEEMTPTALRQGEINAGSVPAELVDDLDEQGLAVLNEPPSWAAKMLMNHDRGPLSDVRVRRALARAVDKEEIVKIACRGHAIPGSPGLLPPSNQKWHNPAVKGYDHDPDRCRELLEKAGYEQEDGRFTGRDGRNLEFELLVTPGRHDFGRVAELLQRQLREAGITIRLRSVEAKSLDAAVGKGDFQLALTGHGGLGGDPEILTRMVVGESFHSANYRDNQSLVDLLQRQLRATDEQERKELVKRAQDLYARDLPAITLYHPEWYWAHDGGVDLFYTPGGIGGGIPIPLNKLCFVEGTEG